MLSDGEVETCKQEARNYIEFMKTAGDNAGWTRGLLWYIAKLEKKADEAYWKGYIEKQNEAMQICKICPKVARLESKIKKYELETIPHLEGELKVYKEQR